MLLNRSAGFFLTAALVLAACAPGSGGAKASKDDSGQAAITVASLKVAGTAPVELAQRKGFFAKEGLDVTVKYVEPAAAVPSVVGGQAQFSVLNVPAVLVARTNHVPVVGVSVISTSASDPADYPIRLLTTKDSRIKEVKDLKGKKVAVDTLYQLPDLTLRTALRARGMDPSDVKFVEIPFPQMEQALTSGRVDAADMTEPFATMSEKAKGLRTVLSNAEGQNEDWPQTITLASEQYAKANATVVAAFQRAMNAAVAYTHDHPDEARTVVTKYTPVPAAIANDMKIPNWRFDAPSKGWQKWAEVLQREGAVQDEVDVSAAYRSAR
ncbi:ABC transporter substrate-binding protein [Streptomyces luteolifulvus]|uniref:ABC transporter substrate-binding protein n=1 Tax=Streptomyces luteolifulvus TaxID=2615112 RepID=A0A6H9UPG5_9ACTN|nr:ABC transporter substrate-binding protein [Streptomyces luteolifulvus]KAB1139638.1 ABC transporter substrate-binding protein [Streptomyces luteolifulvus]